MLVGANVVTNANVDDDEVYVGVNLVVEVVFMMVIY